MNKTKKPIYEPPEIDETLLSEQEVLEARNKETLHKIREKKIKKAFKTARLRGLKNFLFWLLGVFSSIGILVGAVFVGVKVIPLDTYLKWSGQDSSQIVSENISKKSVFDAIASFGDYKVSDIPVLETFVQDLLDQTGIDDFVVVDYDALKDVKFFNADGSSDLIDRLSKCIKLNPQAEFISDLKAFNEYSTANCPLEKPGIEWTVKEGVNAGIYCFTIDGASVLNAPYSAKSMPIYHEVIVDGEINEYLRYLPETSMESVTFYYKPVKDLPLFDVVNGINEIVGRLEINEILSFVGEGGNVDPLIIEVFGGYTIGSLTADFDIAQLFNKIKLSGIEDIDQLLGDLGSLTMFKSYEKVADDQKPSVENGVIGSKYNSALFYYEVEAGVYERAFDDEGNRKEGVDDSTDLYYPNLLDVPVIELLNVIGDRFSTLYVNELLQTFGANFEDDSLIVDILEGKKLSELGSITIDQIKLTSVFAYSGSEDMYKIILSATDKMPERQDGEEDDAFELRVKEQADSITLKDLEGLNTDNINLNVVLPEESNQGIYDIVRSAKNLDKDQPVLLSHLTGLSIDDVKLVTVLEAPTVENGYANQKLYEILIKALTITDEADQVIANPTYEDIRIKHLSKFELDDICLDVILPYYDALTGADNRALYEILLEATGYDLADKTDAQIEELAKNLTIDDVTHFDISNIRISTAIVEASDQLKEILGTSVYKEGVLVPYEKVTLKDLKFFDVSNVKLDLILPYYDNSDPMNVVDNRKIYKVIVEACGLGKAEDAESIASTIEIKDLNNFNMDNLSLSAVLETPSASNSYKNKTLYDILIKALTVTDTDGNGLDYSDIKLSDLGSFNTGKITLASVMTVESGSVLETVLKQACGASNFADITVADFTDKFDMNNVELSSVMKQTEVGGKLTYGNDILDVLIGKGGVTVGNIGEKFNELYLEEVYPAHCFTTTQTSTLQAGYYLLTQGDIRIYVHESVASSYGLDTSGQKYYVSKEAHIWLFLHYGNVWEYSAGNTLSGHDVNGNALVYVDAHHKLSQLQDDVDHMSEKVMGATIRQLVDADIIDDFGGFTNQDVYVMTMGEMINFIGNQ